MFEKLFEGLKEVFEVMQEKRNNIAQVKETLGRLETLFKTSDTQVKTTLEGLETLLKTSDAKINDGLFKNYNSLDEINTSIKDLSENAIGNLHNSVVDLNDRLKVAQDKNSDLDGRLGNVSTELGQARLDLSDKDNKIEEYKKTVTACKTRLENDTAEKKDLNGKLEAKEKDLQACQNENKSLSAYKTTIETALSPLIKILKCCYEYEDLRIMIVKDGLSPAFNETDYRNIFAFISLLGKETGFALTVYAAIKKVKIEARTPLNEVEMRLVSGFNSYYRDKFGYKFDVLDMLDGKTEFDKTLMRDITAPENSDPKIQKVKHICVPVCRKGPDGSEVLGRAYIVGA